MVSVKDIQDPSLFFSWVGKYFLMISLKMSDLIEKRKEKKTLLLSPTKTLQSEKVLIVALTAFTIYTKMDSTYQ